ncbi:salivary lipocalin-like [Hipposideros larvatus]
MKLLLLCLGLTLVWAHEEGNDDVVTSNFDVPKISGKWNTILLGSDVRKRIEENSVMRIFMENIQGWDNSSLSFKFHVRLHGECIEMTGLCDQTSENGVYNVIYAGFDTFRIVEVVYSDYIIFHLISFNNEQTFQMMALFAREPDVSPKLKKRFAELCQNYGITEENIVDVSQDDNYWLTPGKERQRTGVPVCAGEPDRKKTWLVSLTASNNPDARIPTPPSFSYVSVKPELLRTQSSSDTQ